METIYSNFYKNNNSQDMSEERFYGKYKNILVEGGSKTISELINNKYIDILQFMIAPILIGSGINSLNLKEISNLNKAIRPKHNFNELENEIIVNLFLNS